MIGQTQALGLSTSSDLVIVDPKLWDSLSFGREPPGKDLVGEGGSP